MRSRFLAVLMVAAATTASAQTFPVTPGTLELQVGFAAITLPEGSDGSYSAQPQVRLGMFLAPGLALQVEGSFRIWPLGAVAPGSIGASAQIAWFPTLGQGNRNLYLMAGAGATRNDPPARTGLDTSTDPQARVGLGYKIPLSNLDLGFVSKAHLNVEYRAEFLLEDETALVSGASLGLAYFF
jgi:hypothetical protein